MPRREQMLSETYPDASSVTERVYNNLTRSTQNVRMDDSRQIDAAVHLLALLIETLHARGILETTDIDSMMLRMHLLRSDLDLNNP